MESH
jgi:hypothetical protein